MSTLQLLLAHQTDCIRHMFQVTEWCLTDVFNILQVNKQLYDLAVKNIEYTVYPVYMQTKLLSRFEKFVRLKHIRPGALFDRIIYTDAERTKPHKLKTVHLMRNPTVNCDLLENLDTMSCNKIDISTADFYVSMTSNSITANSQDSNIITSPEIQKIIDVIDQSKIQTIRFYYVDIIFTSLPSLHKLEFNNCPSILQSIDNNTIFPNLSHLVMSPSDIIELTNHDLSNITKLTIMTWIGGLFSPTLNYLKKFPSLNKVILACRWSSSYDEKRALLASGEFETVIKCTLFVWLNYNTDMSEEIPEHYLHDRVIRYNHGALELSKMLFILMNPIKSNASVRITIAVKTPAVEEDSVILRSDVIGIDGVIARLIKYFVIQCMAIWEIGVTVADAIDMEPILAYLGE